MQKKWGCKKNEYDEFAARAIVGLDVGLWCQITLRLGLLRLAAK